jgi:hypothetical protein
MEAFTLAIFMFFLSVIVIIMGVVIIEIYGKIREEKIKEELKKKYPTLKGIL